MSEYYGTGLSVEDSKSYLRENHLLTQYGHYLDEGVGCAVFKFSPTWESDAFENDNIRAKLKELSHNMNERAKLREIVEKV